MRGGRHSTTFNLQSDLDYVRGIQSLRTGISLDGGDYRSDDAIELPRHLPVREPRRLRGWPAAELHPAHRRSEHPLLAIQAGLYVQDDIRVRKSLTLSPGMRYEAQTHLSDYNNFGPRFGVTWAPFKNGKTTLRGSWGIFYDWLNAGTYEQTLRVDGFRQRELNIAKAIQKFNQ